MQQAQLANVSLQDQVYHLLQQRPELRRNLSEMIEWERANPQREKWEGFTWQEVHTPPVIINQLIAKGMLDCTYSSGSSKHYRLCSLPDIVNALAADLVPTADDKPVDFASLFRYVYGHEKVKRGIILALQATSPVHCLLMGTPGTAKTLILRDVALLPGGHYYVGSTATKSGLLSLLLEAKPRFLVLDELDSMDGKDMTPLLELMEGGYVSRLMHAGRERVQLDTRVFAGGNDVRRISPAIISRFARFAIPAYTTDEFVRIAKMVLTEREGQGPHMAKLIAEEVARHSTDIRDIVRVSRMSDGNPQQVLEVVSCLWPVAGKPTIAPITPMR